MARASTVFDLLSPRERETFLRFLTSREEKLENYLKQRLKVTFQHWLTLANHLKKIKMDEEQRKKVLEILRTSTRGQRSTMEKEVLRRFVNNSLICIPKSISFTEMDQLCNEIDWYPLLGRSIVFLQGDFGNVYYMIASGSVGLYLEPSKDREMTIAREFGGLRGQPYLGSDEDLKRLGNNILNLSAGNGFGEYAILAATNKIRSCAAVAVEENTLLLVLHADTYNAVLRQHHYRQKQLSSATALLSELPLFKGHNYSKIASIAYTMRSQSYSSGTILAKHGEIINNVLLIASGQVKVYAPPAQGNTHTDEKDKNTPTKRLPRLAVCLLGRGQIVGEIEISKNSRTFQMTYETCSATTEILEMPATTFKDSISTEEIKQSMIYKSIEDINEEKEQRRVGRLTRAYDAVKKMMEGNSSEKKAKDELMSILPAIIDPAVNDSPNISAKNTSFRGGNEFSSPSKPTRRLSNIPINLLEGGVGTDSVAVTRKASFAVKNLEDLEKVYDSSFSAKIAGQTLSTKNTKSAMPTDTTLGPPSNTKKSSIMNSPRKLTFAPK